VSRPITILDWVLSKDNNLVLLASLGPEINSPACLCALQGPRIVVYVVIVSYSAPTVISLSHSAAKRVAISFWTLWVPVSNLVPEVCYSSDNHRDIPQTSDTHTVMSHHRSLHAVCNLRSPIPGVPIPVRSIFFYFQTSRRALGPFQPPIQRGPGLPEVVKRPGREVISTSSFSSDVKNE